MISGIYRHKRFWMHIFGFVIRKLIPKGIIYFLVNLYFEGILLLTFFVLFSEERLSFRILSIIQNMINQFYLNLLGIDRGLQNLEDTIRHLNFKNNRRVPNFRRFRVGNRFRHNEADNFTWRNNTNNITNNRSLLETQRLLNTDTICATHQLFDRHARRCTATCRWRHALICRNHKI